MSTRQTIGDGMGSGTIFSDPQVLSDGSSVIFVTGTTWWGSTRAIGMYTVAGSDTTWTPAMDSSRATLIGVCTGLIAATLGTIAVLRRPPWPDMSERTMAAIQSAKYAVGAGGR